MTDKATSVLPLADTLVGNEIMPLVQGGVLKQVLASNFVTDLGLSTGGGGGGGAPVDATYIVTASDTTLTNEKVATSGASITVDTGTVGQAIFKRAALTGDVTAPADSNATTIAANAVDNTKLANMGANSVKVNNTSSSADPTDVFIGASQLLGRGTGDLGPVGMGTNLTLTGTTVRTLNVTIAEASILAAGNFLRSVSNGDGSFSLVLPDNSVLESVTSVYALSGITISGVATLPAANTVPTGTVVRLHKNNFVGQGANPVGVFIVADNTANVWRPHNNRQVLFYSKFGTIAAPTVSLTAAGRFAIGTDPKIPAGLLSSAAKMRFRFKFKKEGTTAPNIRLWLGTDTTTYTNNSALYQSGTAATADLDVSPEVETLFTGATSAITTRSGALGGGGAAGAFADVSTNINIASQMMVTYAAHTLSGDTVNLYAYEIIWED